MAGQQRWGSVAEDVVPGGVGTAAAAAVVLPVCT